MRVMIEFRGPAAEDALRGMVDAPLATDAALPELPGVSWDTSLPLIPMPGGVGAPEAPSVAGFEAIGRAESTWIACGEIDANDLDRIRREIDSRDELVGIYADPRIDFSLICQGSPPVQNEAAVAQRLDIAQLHQHGLDGLGVLLAMVDSGSNQPFLHQRGKLAHQFDQARSVSIRPDLLPPGNVDLTHPEIRHGTMVAFDSLIAAPRATLLDVITVVPGAFEDHLRRVLWGYQKLFQLATTLRSQGNPFALVVNSSWALYNTADDLPLGPGSFRNDPSHPVTQLVRSLDMLGVDMVFAAGNCGAGCPYPRCDASGATIYGANSYPSALCVGAVDVTHQPLGYTPQGPGFLTPLKPDLCAYSHFAGSGLFNKDAGTSAAAPVAAGVIAALRTRLPYDPVQNRFPPSFLRQVLRATARRNGNQHHPVLGWGIIDPVAAARRAGLLP